ncbi:MAG: hypothetical protein WBP81_35995 [Solirubrobacteraceae bacterium]
MVQSFPGTGGTGHRHRLSGPVFRRWGVIAAVVVILVAVLFVVLTGMRPAYDAYGWMVWGRQTLHWNLDTNGAPSWKPLTFLFTLPYALAGRAEVWLWMVTAVAGALSGAVFAGRIAYKLTAPAPDRRYAPVAAAVFAGCGLFGICDYWHYVLLGDCDPIIVSLCLAAVDCHLSRRPRLAFGLLVLASLGRPGVWPFAGLYALWAWRAIPSIRPLLPIAIASIPALWFTILALTAKSWLIAGELALNSPNALHGDKIAGVLHRFLSLYDWPMQLAALAAVALAVRRRDRATLLLAAAASMWVVIEIAFAFHGWSAVPRYLVEPAAIMVVLAGSAVGNVLALTACASTVLRCGAPLAVLVLVVALIPSARKRARLTHTEIIAARHSATQIKRLDAVISRDGGAARILACGQPVTDVEFQSTLAWETGLNVGNVGYKPGREIRRGQPIVLFRPHLLGWQVRPIHIRAADRASCTRLTTDTPFS